ncbi:hypothetical protein [Photobacterium alginatilyticum]|uniref:Uncharacterized protein n=1 Tax=Photobacterium alginatilyticum TaxID=1775171 RepID=A0ABW9YSA2_9GAMM|nr:hypothetical protein [Photobacterium alginatilyticum]NBI56215.1 hypothetical protein [Photobacterium alginatilyticum]
MEEKVSKAETIAKSVEKISDSKGLAAIGDGLGMGIVALAFCMAFPMLMFASKWDGKLHEEKQCYEIKEIENRVYKLNTCTGDLNEIKNLPKDNLSK